MVCDELFVVVLKWFVVWCDVRSAGWFRECSVGMFWCVWWRFVGEEFGDR